jgi:ubiquinone/menaquinone biosynthesis C-methylase UbiE
MLELQHGLKLDKTLDEKARQNFVSGLRAYILNDMATDMRAAYEGEVRPRFERAHGRAPRDGAEVHAAMRGNEYFKFYSSMRVTAQDMVWQSVLPVVDRERDTLVERAQVLAQQVPGVRLELDPSVAVPRSVSAIDVHLMPGSYDRENQPDDLSAGAVYDNGLAVFSFGLMGQNLDDIGQSVSRFVRAKYPGFKPRRILDLGCTIGHNTGSWKDSYPAAEVTGVDVAAPCLRYGAARARAQGRAIEFVQMNAESLAYDDARFDLVFSSMFLHEVPRQGIAKVLSEARRVLKPGGLMLHMELPPNSQMSPYDAFYLDWDSYYNNEPYYKPFRDQKPEALCRAAGFAAEKFVQFVVPSVGWYGEQGFKRALAAETEVDSDKTGRLADGIQWYCFGAWK